jgi:two-component system, response regulator / RNA-binding antiterminator
MLRILVVDESVKRAAVLREALTVAGYEVVGSLESPLELIPAIDRETPEVVVIATETPSREALAHVSIVTRDRPRPIVMFAEDDASETIRMAVKAGVSAYVVDGVAAARVGPIVEVALARFAEFQRLQQELDTVKGQLADRKVIERAKGLLMKAKRLDEEIAYTQLRSMAMNRGKRIAEIAQSIVDATDLLA